MAERKKVTVVGAGFVGSTIIRLLAEKDYCDCVLLDLNAGVAQGKSLDLMQASVLEDYAVLVQGGGCEDYHLCEGSDVVVITAGLPRQPHMTREDLIDKNASIVRDVVKNVMRYNSSNNHLKLIIVSNPLDIMTQLASIESGLPSSRVLGMAGVLDSARYRYFIAEALNVVPSSVHATVLGGHGDAMVPLPRYSTVNGIPISHFLNSDQIEVINERTKNGGAEIVKYLQKGSAYYAPAASVVNMLRSLLLGMEQIIPCCVDSQGAYGLQDVYCGLPCRLNQLGVVDIVELDLTEEESTQLRCSSAIIKDHIDRLMSKGTEL